MYDNGKNRPADEGDFSKISPERLAQLADLAAELSGLDKLASTKPKGNA